MQLSSTPAARSRSMEENDSTFHAVSPISSNAPHSPLRLHNRTPTMLSTSLSRDNTSQSSPVQSKSANRGARSREDPTSERRRQKTLSPLRLTKPSPALPHDGTWLTSSSAAWPALNVAASGRELNFEDDPYFTKGFPLGSIFYHFSEEEEEERRRLRNRKCPEDATTYYSRARHFKEVQDRRRFVPPNAFYELLKKNAQTADDLERQVRIDRD